MERQYQEKLRANGILLLPGAQYVVSSEFQDADGLTHPVGEAWIYLGCEYRKLFGGYVLYVESKDGKEVSFRMAHRRFCTDTPTVLDKLEKYIVGPDALSTQLVSMLSPQSQASLARVKHWLNPTSDTATGFIYALERAHGDATTANDRGSGGYEQVLQDLNSVLSEAYVVITKLPPNKSLQATPQCGAPEL